MSHYIQDSSSVDVDRLLSQHQAALTLLQRTLLDPTTNEVKWLDLACGQGQIIKHLDGVLHSSYINKIEYLGCDIHVEYISKTRVKAKDLGFKSYQVKVMEIEEFVGSSSLPPEFDFITFTNTAHEINHLTFPAILVECILRLSKNGCLFVYDMEMLPLSELELRAITWSSEEIQEIIVVILQALEIHQTQILTAKWKHSTVTGWSLQLHRSFLNINHDLGSLKNNAILKAADKINELIIRKLDSTKRAIEALEYAGADTPDEAKELKRFLYDYYALSNAIEVKR